MEPRFYRKPLLFFGMLLTAFTFTTTGCQAQRVVYVKSPPPKAHVEVRGRPPVARGYAWVPGHWGYRRGHYRWVKGHWAKIPRRKSAYVPGHWVRRPRGWVWMPGRWR